MGFHPDQLGRPDRTTGAMGTTKVSQRRPERALPSMVFCDLQEAAFATHIALFKPYLPALLRIPLSILQ